MVTEINPDLKLILTEISPEPKTVLDVRQVGEAIGIPVIIRHWWGSRRQTHIRYHKNCGHTLVNWGGWWCMNCNCPASPNEIQVEKLQPGCYVCPAGWSNQLKWPAVEGDHVVMWEGRCRQRYRAAQRKRYNSDIHVHRQTVEVLDHTTTAMLVRVSVGSHRLSFLIGRDDGRPFAHPVTKSQVTVIDAYGYIVPLPVFNAKMRGFDVKRQGDWFFVPRECWNSGPITDEERRTRPWPGKPDCFTSTASTGTIYTKAPLLRTRHIADRLIYSFPHLLVRGSVTAPDHPTVHLGNAWHRAIRNIRPAAYNSESTVDD